MLLFRLISVYVALIKMLSHFIFFVWTITRKDLIRSGNFSPSNLHFLHTVFILVLRARKGSLYVNSRNLRSIHSRVLRVLFTDFLNYNGTWAEYTLPEKRFGEEQLWKENTSAQNLIVGEFAKRIRRKTSQF